MSIFTIGLMLVGSLILLVYCFTMLWILLIDICYLGGYIYDCLFGNWLYAYLLKKKAMNFKIFKRKWCLRIIECIEPKQSYARYETPIFSFCFSYSAIILIYILFSAFKAKYAFVYSYAIYILLFFVGMRRKYEDEEKYITVLKNNESFLKISFAPWACIMTIIGFAYTVFGMTLKYKDVCDWLTSSLTHFGDVSFANGYLLVGKLIILSVVVLIIMYVISIPLQLVSYFIIRFIKYMLEYGDGYKKIWSLFKGRLKKELENIYIFK